MSNLVTYPRGLNEPDHVRHADPSKVPGRVTPGDQVTHVRDGGFGTVVGVTDDKIVVLWSKEPATFWLPEFTKVIMPLIKSQMVDYTNIGKKLFVVEPLPMPKGLIFYRDYTYGSGSQGEKPGDE